MRIAILDDYEQAALDLADWSALRAAHDVDVYHRGFTDPTETVAMLKDYDVITSMRERSHFSAATLQGLPQLKLLCFTGLSRDMLDLEAAAAQGITVCNTLRHGVGSSGTPELAFGFILALARGLHRIPNAMRQGGWTAPAGMVIAGKSLGLVGLGRHGSYMARLGRAFDMNVLAWSPNLTQERAAVHGTTLLPLDELLSTADFVSLHARLTPQSTGVIGRGELSLMKREANLVNTARAGLIDEVALVEMLAAGHLAGAAMDVMEIEPLPDDAPLRCLPNTLLTPHIGYTVRERMATYYKDVVENIEAWLAGSPIRTVGPGAQPH